MAASELLALSEGIECPGQGSHRVVIELSGGSRHLTRLHHRALRAWMHPATSDAQAHLSMAARPLSAPCLAGTPIFVLLSRQTTGGGPAGFEGLRGPQYCSEASHLARGATGCWEHSQAPYWQRAPRLPAPSVAAASTGNVSPHGGMKRPRAMSEAPVAQHRQGGGRLAKRMSCLVPVRAAAPRMLVTRAVVP